MSIKELEKIKILIDSVISEMFVISETIENLTNEKSKQIKINTKKIKEDAESNDEAKEVFNKKVRKPITKKEVKKTITIIDDSNDEPLIVEV